MNPFGDLQQTPNKLNMSTKVVCVYDTFGCMIG